MTKCKKILLKIVPALLLGLMLFTFIGCKTDSGLDKYVSEKRTEIYYCEQDGFTLTASYSQKEYPYCADGIVGELSDLFEIKLQAPDNSEEYNIKFTLAGKEYGGEMSFESVRQIYTFSQSIACPKETQITFTVSRKDSEVKLVAESVKNENTLGLSDILKSIQKAEPDRISALSQNGTFAGEIYVRLVYKDGECFYYAAISDRSGNTYSMLIDADSGEILATREN